MKMMERRSKQKGNKIKEIIIGSIIKESEGSSNQESNDDTTKKTIWNIC
jgi:hypothetical protein